MDTNFFSHIFLPIVLAVIMLGMGLSLTFSDFKRVLQYPKGILIGLFCQLVLLPSIAFGIARVSGLPPAMQVGLVLIASCPGGISSGLLTHLFRGNVALSISLTSLNSLITLLTIPAMVNLGLLLFMGEQQRVWLPVGRTAFEIFVLTVLPAMVGVLIRRRYIEWSVWLEKPLRYIMPILLMLAFLGVMFLEEKGNWNSVSEFVRITPFALLLNFLGMTCTFVITKLANFEKSIQLTLPIEAGLHNSSLAIFIASAVLNDPQIAMVGVSYGSITFFSTALFSWIIYKFAK